MNIDDITEDTSTDDIIKMVVGVGTVCDFMPLESIKPRTDADVAAMDLNSIVLFPGSLAELYAKDPSTRYRVVSVRGEPGKTTYRSNVEQLSDMQPDQDARFEREFKKRLALSGFDGLVRCTQTQFVGPQRVRGIDWDLMEEVDMGPGLVFGDGQITQQVPGLCQNPILITAYREIVGAPIVRIKDGGAK